MFTDTLLNIGVGRSAVAESGTEPEIAAVSIDTVEECVGDPFEFLTGVYYENEMNLTNINQAIMVCEYAYLKDTGSEMVYESNVITNMFDNVGKAISKAWDQICAFFKKIYRWLGDTFAADKLWIKTYTKKLETLKKEYPGAKVEIPFKGYTFSRDNNTMNSDPANIADDALTIFGKIADAVKDESKMDTDDVAKTLHELRSDLVESTSTGLDPSQFTKELSAYFVGRKAENIVLKVDIKSIEKQINYVSSVRSTKTSLDDIYASTKKSINSLLGEVKKAKATAVKSDKAANGKEAAKDIAKKYHAKATLLNSCTSILTQVNKTAVKAIVTQNRQNKVKVGAAINAIIAETKKETKKSDDKEEVKSESASIVDTIFSTILG